MYKSNLSLPKHHPGILPMLHPVFGALIAAIGMIVSLVAALTSSD